jgi:endonuclease V-like protein UPF0215 family
VRFHNNKKGIRILAIAESFQKHDRKSILAGVVMRRDLVVDGIIYADTIVGGNDGTNKVLAMIDSLDRTDINCVLLGGLIISLFKILSGKHINEITKIPVIAISYRRSPGIQGSIRGVDEPEKIKEYLKLEERKPLTLWTGKTIFVRHWGLDFVDTSTLLNDLVIQGSKPEPLRLAALAARAYHNYVR